MQEKLNQIIPLLKGVTADSRLIKPGFAFVAIKGEKLDGKDYIQAALEKGATHIIIEGEDGIDNARRALAYIASKLYQPQPENIVAVTGTSGKTSVAHYFRELASFAGYKSASIGTFGVVSEEINIDDGLTSPPAEKMHQYLKELKSKNIDYVAIEASSHGLSQSRLDFIPFKAAAFTNLSQDHLDYHKDMEEYLAAKMILFSDLLKDGVAVLNQDIKEFEAIKKVCNKIIIYGKEKGDVSFAHDAFNIMGERIEACPNVFGEYQYYNIAAAIGLAVACDIKITGEMINALHAPEGRLEKLDKANIFIDYAHKPEALEKAILTLKSTTSGRLIVVFGCGGNRDKLKRPIMGEIASRLADMIIVTDDNPRFEDAAQIRAEILSACPKGIEIGNREEAIKYAISIMEKDDALLIAGKGHEDYQIIGDKKIHFSDKEIAKEYLKNI